MQDREMRELLGDAYDETTDGQRRRIAKLSEQLDSLYVAGEDDRGDALASGIAIILGDRTLEDAGVDYWGAMAATSRARASFRGAVLASTGSERAMADEAGVARETIRKALGK